MRRAAVLAFALVLGAALEAGAQQAGPASIQVFGKIRLGYIENECDPGWLPVTFPLENRVANAPVTVELSATASTGQTPIWSSEKTVTLPPGSRRIETLYLRIDEGVSTVEANVLVGGQSRATASRGIQFRGDRMRRASSGLPVDLHALVVREGLSDVSLTSWLEPASRSAPGVAVPEPPPVVLSKQTVEARELPDRPEGYGGIDVVLLSKTSARDLDEPRRRSLLAWVRNGGRIILLPGNDVGWFRDELVKSLLPPDAEVSAVENVPLETLAPLIPSGRIASMGTPSTTPTARLYQVKSTRFAVRVAGEHLDKKRIPYFTLFKQGAGDVIVAAFDLESQPFATAPRACSELGRLLHTAIEPIPDRHRLPDDERLAPWFEAALAESELPSPLLLIPLVLAYVLCMGPINQRIVRRSSTPVVSIVTIPVIAGIFTVVCFFAGYIVRGTSASLDRVAVVEVRPGDDIGREWAGVSLRSASSTRYTVSADPLLALTQRPISGTDTSEYRGAPPAATRMRQDEGRMCLRDLPLNLWERAFFQACSAVPLGGAVTIEVTPRSCTITNGTKLDLGPGVIVLTGTEGFRVPPLAPGAKATLDGSMASSVKAERPEILAAILGPETAQKVGDKALASFLNALRVETTYVAVAKSLPSALEVAERAKPDRDLAVLIVQADDQARDEEVYRWAGTVARERWHDEYDDVLAMLDAIRPTSRWFHEAQTVKSFIATQRFVDTAEDAYDKGDLDRARDMVLEVLRRPELDRDSVHEIRKRLDRWATVVARVHAGCRARSNVAATRAFQAAVDLEPTANVFRQLAQARLDELKRTLGGEAARDQAITAAIENRAGAAVILLRTAQQQLGRNLKRDDVNDGIAAAEQRWKWAKLFAGWKGDALERAVFFERAELLRGWLPLDDPRRDEAVRFLDDQKPEPLPPGEPR